MTAAAENVRLHPIAEPRAKVLSGHRGYREPERDDRHETGLNDPQADAETRLRGGAERPRDDVHDEKVDGHQRELRAGRQAYLQHLPPERQSRRPRRGLKVEISARLEEIPGQPDRAHHDRHERRQRGAGDAKRHARAPAEDQKRREDHVDDDRCRLHDHAGLEVSCAAQRRPHRDHRELQRHRGNEPGQVLGRHVGRPAIGAECRRVRRGGAPSRARGTTPPTTTESTCDWLKTSSARSRSF